MFVFAPSQYVYNDQYTCLFLPIVYIILYTRVCFCHIYNTSYSINIYVSVTCHDNILYTNLFLHVYNQKSYCMLNCVLSGRGWVLSYIFFVRK